MRLKQARQSSKLTQQEAADLLQVSLRSYKTYENDPGREDTLKYRYRLEQLEKHNTVDEDHGILDLEAISRIGKEVFENIRLIIAIYSVHMLAKTPGRVVT